MNSDYTNHTHPYFKCILCKLFNRHKHNKCIMKLVRNGEVLCGYSTLFSIWKWFVRIMLFMLIVVLIHFNIKYVWYYTLDSLVHLSKYNEYECTGFEAFCAFIGWMELIGLTTFIFWSVIKAIYYLHREFKDRGGKYW